MGDTVSKKRRSEIMSKIKSKDSKIKVEFRKALWRKGFRYRKNPTNYFGKPDLVLPKDETAYFLIIYKK
jgi:DNA mismatch endonuclease (patch repair protein)